MNDPKETPAEPPGGTRPCESWNQDDWQDAYLLPQPEEPVAEQQPVASADGKEGNEVAA